MDDRHVRRVFEQRDREREEPESEYQRRREDVSPPIEQLVDTAEARRVMRFYDHDELLQKCEVELASIVLGDSWAIEWGGLQGHVPAFYNAPPQHSAIQRFLLRMATYMRVLGLAVFWYERRMSAWLDAVAMNHDLATSVAAVVDSNGETDDACTPMVKILRYASEGGTIGTGDRLPFGVAELDEVSLHQVTLDARRPLHTRMVARANAHTPRFARCARDSKKGGETDADMFDDYGFAVITTEGLMPVPCGQRGHELRLEPSPIFANLYYRMCRVQEAEKNRSDADFTSCHPRAVMTLQTAPVSRADTDLLTAESFHPSDASVAMAVAEMRMNVHSFNFDQATPLVEALRGRGACGEGKRPDGPANVAYLKELYGHADPLDDAVFLPEIIKPLPMSDPKSLVNVADMWRDYERAVYSAMGLAPAVSVDQVAATSSRGNKRERSSTATQASLVVHQRRTRERERTNMNVVLRQAHGLTYGLYDVASIETVLAYIEAAHRVIDPVARAMLDPAFQQRVEREYPPMPLKSTSDAHGRQRRDRETRHRAALMRQVIHAALHDNWRQRHGEIDREARRLRIAAGATLLSDSSNKSLVVQNAKQPPAGDTGEDEEEEEDEASDDGAGQPVREGKRRRRRKRRRDAILNEAIDQSTSPWTLDAVDEALGFLEDAGTHFRALIGRGDRAGATATPGDWKTVSPTALTDVAMVASGNVVRLVFYEDDEDDENILLASAVGHGGGGSSSAQLKVADVLLLREAGAINDDDMERWLVEIGLRQAKNPAGDYLRAQYSTRPAAAILATTADRARTQQQQGTPSLLKRRIEEDSDDSEDAPARKKQKKKKKADTDSQ